MSVRRCAIGNLGRRVMPNIVSRLCDPHIKQFVYKIRCSEVDIFWSIDIVNGDSQFKYDGSNNAFILLHIAKVIRLD